MPEALALGAAVVFGLVHFFSGLLARRADSWAVALYGQIGGVVVVAAAAVFWPAPQLTLESIAWGALSGVGTGVGVAFLYRGLSTGRMSVVVPVSDVGAVALPVLVGVALLGDRPTALAWVGVAAALPALWLVSRSRQAESSHAETGTLDGLIAGAGFALQFIAISRIDLEGGLWPILAARILAAVTIVPLGLRSGARLRLPRRFVLPACVVGAAGSVAIVLYFLATQEQLLALATVLAALYPAIPVLLAMLFLHERLSRPQVVGLMLTAAAIGLISLG
ncbi:DMT family transporter [Mycolicibacterium flavescens]|uniref:Multidrug DMT transporter permease n=1 Tax=Mycolicibacterium flavescens TaxID=1776 RepID=A0A1E3RI38_MYCFV|nr:DMT family transporter [Mycolicibacterium flavescens]MCV7282220.1 DMT family transporter [Mycolicibacterium flavescens]ODQ89528.1 multidrug DMT transporter permease [Mycolicibacterium flavescens]